VQGPHLDGERPERVPVVKDHRVPALAPIAEAGDIERLIEAVTEPVVMDVVHKRLDVTAR
jgi:hypothetical protein